VLEASYDDETIQDVIDVSYVEVACDTDRDDEADPEPEPQPDPEPEPEVELEAEHAVEVEGDDIDDVEIDLTGLDDPTAVEEKEAKEKRSRIPRLTVVWPGDAERSVPPGFPGEDVEPTPEPSARMARTPGRVGPLRAIVAAVYSALADPLGSDPAAREQRAQRVRKAGVVTGSVVVTAVLIYTVFPVRTYLDQRSATDRAKQELDVLSDANAKLAERAEDLRTPEVIEQKAREDYGLVYPNEESYRVLPPPVVTTAPTTTTTTPPIR